MPKYLGDVRCWGNSGKHLLEGSFSGFTQLRHSVTLRAPHECADPYYLMSGRKVSVPPDRLMEQAAA